MGVAAALLTTPPLKSLWLSERLLATVIAAPAAPTKQAKMRSDAFTLEHLYRLLARLLFSGEQHHGSSQQLPSKTGELSDTLGYSIASAASSAALAIVCLGQSRGMKPSESVRFQLM